MTYIPAVKNVGAVQIVSSRSKCEQPYGIIPMISVQICIRKAFAL